MKPQTIQSDRPLPLVLFLYFFKIGWYTFGGGWSIVAQIQKDFVEQRGWITDEELLDITSVGRSIPGLMIGNVSYLFGYHIAGFPGALASLLGLCLPPVIILSLVTYVYSLICDNPYIARAMAGVRAAVVPIVAAAALRLRKAALPERISYLFLLAAAFLYLAFHVSCIWLMLLCGLFGFLYMTWRQKKAGGAK